MAARKVRIPETEAVIERGESWGRYGILDAVAIWNASAGFGDMNGGETPGDVDLG